MFLARIVMPRSRSRSLESRMQSPTSCEARYSPLWRSRQSTSVVFPWSTWAMMAIFRTSLRRMAGIVAGCWSGKWKRLAILPRERVLRYGDDFGDRDILVKGAVRSDGFAFSSGNRVDAQNSSPGFWASTMFRVVHRLQIKVFIGKTPDAQNSAPGFCAPRHSGRKNCEAMCVVCGRAEFANSARVLGAEWLRMCSDVQLLQLAR